MAGSSAYDTDTYIPYTYPSIDPFANIGGDGGNNTKSNSQKCGVQKSHRQTILYLKHTHTHTYIQSRFTIQRAFPYNIQGTHSTAQHNGIRLRFAVWWWIWIIYKSHTHNCMKWEIDYDVRRRFSIQKPISNGAPKEFTKLQESYKYEEALLISIVVFCCCWNSM